MKTTRLMFSLMLIISILADQEAKSQIIRDTIRSGAQINFSLDVEFVQYSAYTTPNGSVIRWSTILETNLDHYDIERSGGNGSFVKIAPIPAVGTMSAAVNYAWTDTKPLTGKNIYRIRMVDTRDGSKIHATRILNWSPNDVGAEPIAFYPNPVSRGANLSIDFQQAGTYQVRLVGMSAGQVERSSVQTDGHSTYQYAIPAHLPRGEYMLVISTGDKVAVQQKIFIQ